MSDLSKASRRLDSARRLSRIVELARNRMNTEEMALAEIAVVLRDIEKSLDVIAGFLGNIVSGGVGQDE